MPTLPERIEIVLLITKFNSPSQVIREHFAENPSTSIRKCAETLNVSYGSIQKYLHAEGMHPYKLQMHQKLDEEDCAHRKSMCEELRKLMQIIF